MSDCGEMHLLVQADMDGELAAAEAARVGAHLSTCAECTALQARMIALSGRLRDMPRHAAPASLRRPGPRRATWTAARLVPFGAGLALAASLALVFMPGQGGLPEAVVSAHIRALQPGHLMDVASSDQHTVKPWFDGRLPFAPPVKDLAAIGSPLAGGRVDYVAGHIAAVLVYRHGPHVIDLFVWPGDDATLPATGARDGYNFVRWRQQGVSFWAMSDLNPGELADFVRQWQGAPS